MARMNVAAAGFGIVALLCIVAAVLPLIRGGSLNGPLLVAGVLFSAVAIAAARRAPKPPTSPGA
jgi:hypothetical protein